MRLKMNDYDRKWDKKTKRWKYTHRMVVEKAIGRILTKDEQVHHVDHNHLNNDLSNLKIVTKSEHMREHKPVYKRKWRPVLQGA